MTTSSKLWWGFGLLVVLLALSSAIIVVRVLSIEGLVQQQADVAKPRVDAAHALEIAVLDYALDVQEFLIDRSPAGLAQAGKDAAAVERDRKVYEGLITNERERSLALRFADLWKALQSSGQALIGSSVSTPSPDAVAGFRARRDDVKRFLDDEMQPDAVGTYDARRQATQLDVQTTIGFVLLLLVIGTIVAIATSAVVGRGVVRAEGELRKAHDELEERVRVRTADLAAAIESLSRSNLELEQFASVASHDLQEPLRKIQAFGDRLQSKFGHELGEQGREYLERILSSAARMRTLINDLLTFSRVTTKAQPFVPTALTAIAQDVVSDLEARIAQSGGRVDVGELPTVDGDPLQMRQLFLNLVSNALKFHAPDRAPVVTITGRVVADNGNSGAATGTEPACEIVVEDNGIGFEEVYLDRIFEVFQRLHGRDEYEGTGIGLAIVRKIVERHRGRITARSSPGRGATFVVTIPVRQTTEEATQ